MEIRSIIYSRGMLESLQERDDCEIVEWFDEEIPPDILSSIQENRILDLEGIWGDERVGFPIEVEQLRIETDEGELEIEVHNRAILLYQFRPDDRLLRLHRLFETIQRHCP